MKRPLSMILILGLFAIFGCNKALVMGPPIPTFGEDMEEIKTVTKDSVSSFDKNNGNLTIYNIETHVTISSPNKDIDSDNPNIEITNYNINENKPNQNPDITVDADSNSEADAIADSEANSTSEVDSEIDSSTEVDSDTSANADADSHSGDETGIMPKW